MQTRRRGRSAVPAGVVLRRVLQLEQRSRDRQGAVNSPPPDGRGSDRSSPLAWYGHLRFRSVPLLVTIFISWLIALPEYALQVPANRFGYGQFSAAQLKIIQEIISIGVFVVFSFFYFKEAPTWQTGVAFLLI